MLVRVYKTLDWAFCLTLVFFVLLVSAHLFVLAIADGFFAFGLLCARDVTTHHLLESAGIV